MRSRKLAFFILASVCVLAIVLSTAIAVRRSQQQRPPISSELPAESRTTSADSGPQASALATTNGLATKNLAPSAGTAARQHALLAQPDLLYFSANVLGENYGKLAVATVGALDRPSYSSELRCERVHFSSGAGICLVADRGFFTSYYAIKFDGEMRQGWKIKLNGAPSRVRVSPTGRLAAITVFLAGHSYASLNFSTQTTIIDVATGNVVADLDHFSVTRDGQEFKSADFNFWGVTFAANENIFYATLWSKAKTYLVRGNLAGLTATVIHDGVECPSLSPDNTRIAFKKRVEQPGVIWNLAVLNLKNGKETSLGESRNVDDQVEWLDNDHILYALSQGDATHSSGSTDIWALASVPGGIPQLMLKGASSPTVVRTRDTGGASVASSEEKPRKSHVR